MQAHPITHRLSGRRERAASSRAAAVAARLRVVLGAALVGFAALAHAPASAAAGDRQSPIDIVANEAVGAPLPDLEANYRVSDVTVVHTFDPGAEPFVPKEFATLRVNIAPGSSVRVNHVVYDLVQFHFHTPSEHTLRGRHTPMEVHFVHLKRGACIGDRDALLVVGARIVAGREHRELEKIFALELPADASRPALPVARFDVGNVLPAFDRSWQYPGSLTAPLSVGCNNPAGSVSQQLATDVFPENVSWVVLSRELQMSKRQIRKFQALFDFEGNARAPQALDGRVVFRDQRR